MIKDYALGGVALVASRWMGWGDKAPSPASGKPTDRGVEIRNHDRSGIALREVEESKVHQEEEIQKSQ